MRKTQVILLVSFLVVFAAGASVGGLIARPAPAPHHDWWVAKELNLTADQQEQMHRIWSEAMRQTSPAGGQGRSGLAQERDRKVTALLTDEQKTEYDAIQQDQSRRLEELSQDRRKANEDVAEQARQKVRAMLSDEQQAQYDAIQQDYTRRVEELSQHRDRAYQQAVEQTRQMLTPEQRGKYDEMRNRQGGPGVPGSFRGPRHPRSAPASRPETETAEPAASRVGG